MTEPWALRALGPSLLGAAVGLLSASVVVVADPDLAAQAAAPLAAGLGAALGVGLLVRLALRGPRAAVPSAPRAESEAARSEPTIETATETAADLDWRSVSTRIARGEPLVDPLAPTKPSAQTLEF